MDTCFPADFTELAELSPKCQECVQKFSADLIANLGAVDNSLEPKLLIEGIRGTKKDECNRGVKGIMTFIHKTSGEVASSQPIRRYFTCE